VERRILKFGGAALRDGRGVRRASEIVATEGGPRPIVVVSALEGVTDLLEVLADAAPSGVIDDRPVRIRHRTVLAQLGLDSELLDRHLAQLFGLLRSLARGPALDRRQRDHVLSYGERMSARIVAAALRAAGREASPVDAFDLGLISSGPIAARGPRRGEAHPPADPEGRVRRALERVPGVPVVTGFLAADPAGNLTTLGPNGSDLTAALLAEALGAPEIQLWKTVAGLMTADPRIVPGARLVGRIGHAEAAELAWHGAGVLHPQAAETALRAGVRIRLGNAEDPGAPGTLVEESGTVSGPVGIALREDAQVFAVHFESGLDRGAALAELLGGLAEWGLEPLMLSAGPGEVHVVVAAAGDFEPLLELEGATEPRDVTLVALVGAGVGADAAVGSLALGALAASGAAPLQEASGDASRLYLIDRAKGRDAARALHSAFFERGGPES